MIDLGSLDTARSANEGFDVQLYHPVTNVDLGITIKILGKDSDTFRKISHAQAKKRMDRFSKGGFRNTGFIQSPEEIEQNGIELLAACTVGWDGIILDGKPLDFSKDNAKELYTRFPWIKEQIDVAVGDRANFIKA